jgi:hypothetical protein
VKKFLEEYKECTHLFFIDSDLKFESRAFVGLVRSGLPICAGLYRRRQAHEDYPLKATENPAPGGGLWFVNDWLQCDRVPTGFLCISRKVLEEMAAEAPCMEVADQKGGLPWLFDLKKEDVKPGVKPTAKTYGEARKLTESGQDPQGSFRIIGEDYSFCDKYVEKYGKPIPVWSNFDFTHHGFKGNFWEYLNREKDKADKDKADLTKNAEANTREDCNFPPVEADTSSAA